MSLPWLLGVIARHAGDAAALRLAREVGGEEMKFSARPGSQLARIVGVEAARAIVAELGTEKRTIPMAHLRGQGARRAEAARLLAAGATHSQIVRACDVHERTVRRVKERLRRKGSLPLFERD